MKNLFAILLILGGVILSLFSGALPSIRAFGFGFLIGVYQLLRKLEERRL